MAQIGVEPNTTREDSPQERSPDSNWVRVSRDTTHESGIPPAREGPASDAPLDSEDHLDQALSEAARTEANLQALVRGLKNLTAGATAVLQSTGLLASELDAVREVIARAHREQAALRQRVHELTQALAESEEKARRELRYVTDQQDLFLAEVLADHERQLAELQQRATEPSVDHDRTEQIAELTAQRDQAREFALRCERERDLAWQELGVQAPAPRPGPSVQPALPVDDTLSRTPTQPPPSRHSSEYSLGAEDVPEERVASVGASAEPRRSD